MKRNRRLWLSSGLLFLILLAGLLLWKARDEAIPAHNVRPRHEKAEVLAKSGTSVDSLQASIKTKGTERKEKDHKEPKTPGAIYREVKKILAEAEAARTTKLAEYFKDGAGSYLYKVEPPSKGEIETVKSQIADLRNEASAARAEELEDSLSQLIDSYDPYGSENRKLIIVRVPASNKERMRAEQIISDDVGRLQEEFMKGGPNEIWVKRGWVANFNGETLERFEHLMIWKPEKE